MDTTSLNMTLFVVTALVAIAVAIWQFRRSGKAKEENRTSAMGEPAQHRGKYDDDGESKYDATAGQAPEAATGEKYPPARDDKYKAAS